MPSKRSNILATFVTLAVPFTAFLVLTFANDVGGYWRARFLFNPGKHTPIAILAWIITLMPYAWVIWRACIRKTDDHTWLEGFRTKIGFSFVMLGVFWYIGMTLDDAASGVLAATASIPTTITGIVTESGSNTPYRATRQLIAIIHTTDGRELTLRDFDDLYTRHIHDVMLVNGNCELAALHKGDTLTVTGHTSTYGFAVDSITTASCEPR